MYSPFRCLNIDIPRESGQYHVCWCPGSLPRRVIINHDMFLISGFHQGGFQLDAPSKNWGMIQWHQYVYVIEEKFKPTRVNWYAVCQVINSWYSACLFINNGMQLDLMNDDTRSAGHILLPRFWTGFFSTAMGHSEVYGIQVLCLEI